MFFWNSLAFSVIQWMLAIWSLVPLPFLNPAWTSGSSQFTYCWSLACRIWALLESPWGIWNLGFPGGLAGNKSAYNVGDLGLIPGLGRSPREGKGYPLQYSGLKNSMDCIVHGVTKSRTWLSDFHIHFEMAQLSFASRDMDLRCWTIFEWHPRVKL